MYACKQGVEEVEKKDRQVNGRRKALIADIPVSSFNMFERLVCKMKGMFFLKECASHSKNSDERCEVYETK